MLESNSCYQQLAPYHMVWREEVEVLRRFINDLPENPVIVEIGTANGGGAALMYDLLAEAATIYSVDLMTSALAAEVLSSSPVRLIQSDSVAFADEYRRVDGRPIDFLFIDGDHSLKGVYRDFEAWLPLVRDGGLIAFHDYDQPERGGVAHFGIQIFMDSLRSINTFSDFHHQYKIPSFRKNSSLIVPTLGQLENEAEKLAALLMESLNGLEELTNKELLNCMSRKPQVRPGLTELDLCYIIDWVRKNRRPILQSVKSGYLKIQKFEELLYTMDEAFGPAAFPQTAPRAKSVLELSRLLMGDQARLVILNEIRGHLTAPDEAYDPITAKSPPPSKSGSANR